MESKLNQKTNDHSKTIEEPNIQLMRKTPGWIVGLDIQKA